MASIQIQIIGIFKKTNIDKAIAELGTGYNVTLQGRFDTKPIGIEIETDSGRWDPLDSRI